MGLLEKIPIRLPRLRPDDPVEIYRTAFSVEGHEEQNVFVWADGKAFKEPFIVKNDVPFTMSDDRLFFEEAATSTEIGGRTVPLHELTPVEGTDYEGSVQDLVDVPESFVGAEIGVVPDRTQELEQLFE